MSFSKETEIFPPGAFCVFAADATGEIKQRLKPSTAENSIRKGYAHKISDNLIQFKKVFKKKALKLKRDEIVLIAAASQYTTRPGMLIETKYGQNEEIWNHNCRAIDYILDEYRFKNRYFKGGDLLERGKEDVYS